MTISHQREVQRISDEFDRRDREYTSERYALDRSENLFIRHGQERALLTALRRARLLPLADRRILEVGFGFGRWLTTFEELGARRELLSGIELSEQRAGATRHHFPTADLRQGDATELPWNDGEFDIVFQSTMFTSILDPNVQAAIAREMLRVLKPKGCIVWYDFVFSNPVNSNVRGVPPRRIAELFPECKIWSKRVTLAPPLARRIVPISWTLSCFFESLRVLNTHCIATLRSRG